MSSSLFDCCGGYESYPKTFKSEGDKTFAEVVEGDTLYFCDKMSNLTEITVTGKLKQHKGHLYLPVKGLYKTKSINFGPTNCHNVSVFAPENSMVEYLSGIIGTNEVSVVRKMLEDARHEYERIEAQARIAQNDVKRLRKLYDEIENA